MGIPQIIQVMNDHCLVVKPMMMWGSPITLRCHQTWLENPLSMRFIAGKNRHPKSLESSNPGHSNRPGPSQYARCFFSLIIPKNILTIMGSHWSHWSLPSIHINRPGYTLLIYRNIYLDLAIVWLLIDHYCLYSNPPYKRKKHVVPGWWCLFRMPCI